MNEKNYVTHIPNVRTESSTPTAYRLINKLDGALVLQGLYQWYEGLSTAGCEWKDIPTEMEQMK